jgi:hypothetical protein
MQRIALVFMNDSADNFFIENCPTGNPEKWIENYVYTKSDVEYVDVYELGNMVANWANPDSSSEDDA